MTCTPTDIQMMTRALAFANRAASLGEVPVGAVVYHTNSGEILAEASNRRERDRDPAGHAEFEAIRRACRALGDWRLNDYSLAVTLEPCAMCAGLIVNARVGRVVFGTADPKAGAVRTLYRLLEDTRLNHQAEVVVGVLDRECANLLTAFFRKIRAAHA
ncbi:MAG: nucleoside deaminase [Planctomycetota bacterium]|nr:MAG: nucleoside deaminase [Planctomycetota bacterium]